MFGSPNLNKKVVVVWWNACMGTRESWEEKKINKTSKKKENSSQALMDRLSRIMRYNCEIQCSYYTHFKRSGGPFVSI